MGKDIVQSQGKTNVMVASLMQGTMAMVLDLVDNNTAGGVVFSVQRITILIESHLKIANKMEVYKMKKVYEVRMEIGNIATVKIILLQNNLPTMRATAEVIV